mmetsp:Transcript_77176/g.249781  ORF Transcript_77176/g.249781 Transcript_77176/m.249781 type:complete len:188 (-) Transcript_77176:75-638(-)
MTSLPNRPMSQVTMWSRMGSFHSQSSKQSTLSRQTSKLSRKMTGNLRLDDEGEELEPDWFGGLLIFDLDANPLGRTDLPKQFRTLSQAEWNPQLFKEYLGQQLNCNVTMVYYKVRDRKKGSGMEGVRMAQLGVDDKASAWPFVPGMRIYIGTPDELEKKPTTLVRSNSGTPSSQGSNSSCASSCALM